MIKFRWGDVVIVVMTENFEKERIEAVSYVSSQTVQFDPELSNTLYCVNQSESVNLFLILSVSALWSITTTLSGWSKMSVTGGTT